MARRNFLSFAEFQKQQDGSGALLKNNASQSEVIFGAPVPAFGGINKRNSGFVGTNFSLKARETIKCQNCQSKSATFV